MPARAWLLRILTMLWMVSCLVQSPLCAATTADNSAPAASPWSLDPAADSAQALLASIHRAHWLREGRGSRVVYIFFDPNCPFSHKLYLASRAFVGKNDLELRWIPVGTLHPSSLGKAAAILQAPDPLRAFRHNENDWDFGDSPAGGITPLKHPSSDTLRRLAANARLLREVGLHVFPVMLFRTRENRAQWVVGLLPPDEIGPVFDMAR